MSDANQRLLALLPSAHELLSARGVSPELIGGVAVHLRCAELVEPEDELLDPTHPRRLATSVRSTNDIDLVVPENQLEVAREALERASFSRVERVPFPPLRMRHGRDIVDLIACPPEAPAVMARADLGAVLALLEDARTPLRVDGTELSVATREALVVLKAVAWTDDPGREGDLVDVARIALLDRETSATARALATLAAELPAVIVSALRRLDGAFARDGSPGPATMVQSLRGAIPGLSLDDDLDLSIRDVVCASVRELLGPSVGR